MPTYSVTGGSIKFFWVNVHMLHVGFNEVLVVLLWAASLAMAVGELPVQKLAGDPGFIHVDDVSCLVQLGFQDY